MFRDLGMTIPQARKLALDKYVDLDRSRKLIASGCDPLLAFDILS